MLRTTLAATLLLSPIAHAQPVGERVEVNGMQMYYEVSGEGDPLIVLHGAYMNIPGMGAIIPKLAETHKVYALELQGHGRTTDIDRPITYPNLADDVAAFMDAVGLAKADVFGYSMGAVTGLQLAIRHPEKVNKLAAASVAYDAEGWQPEFKAFIPQMTVEMFLNLPFAEEYRKLAANPDGYPALVEKLIALEHEPMAWEADVKALKTPVLIISGDADVATLEHAVAHVPAARRRRHGRHGQAAAHLAAGGHAGDLAHRRHRPGRAAPCLRRAVLQGRDAEGDVPVARLAGQPGITSRATTQRFLPIRRVRAKPCRSNIWSVALCRKDPETARPSASSG